MPGFPLRGSQETGAVETTRARSLLRRGARRTLGRREDNERTALFTPICYAGDFRYLETPLTFGRRK